MYDWTQGLKYPAQQDYAISWNSAEFDTKDQQGQASKNPLRKGRQGQSYMSQALYKYAYMLWHTNWVLCDLVCFDKEREHFEEKYHSFLTLISISLLKVRKSQKQIILFSYLPKIEWNLFLILALLLWQTYFVCFLGDMRTR